MQVGEPKIYNPHTEEILPVIPEPKRTSMGVPFWRVLLFGEKAWQPMCCGAVFNNVDSYKVHWLTRHAGKLVYAQGESAGAKREKLVNLKPLPTFDD